jgi:hypothetical protein
MTAYRSLTDRAPASDPWLAAWLGDADTVEELKDDANEDVVVALAIGELGAAGIPVMLETLTAWLGYEPEWGHMSWRAKDALREAGCLYRSPAEHVTLPEKGSPEAQKMLGRNLPYVPLPEHMLHHFRTGE